MERKAKACLGVVLLLSVTAACPKPKPQAQAQAAPLEVGVVRVVQKDVPVIGEWIGTLDGMVNADIRPQVTGYLLGKLYTEGSFVKKGQVLFEIDPRPFQAALDQAKAEVARAQGQVAQANSQLLEARAEVLRAEANLGKTEIDVARYTPLAKARAISEQELDNAVQANLAAKADTEAARARVETAKSAIAAANAAVEAAKAAEASAQLNLGFTQVRSLIDGIAGLARQQTGNLVSPSGEPLTTVSTVDPIKAYFTATEQEYLRYVRRNPTLSERQAREREAVLELVLADDTVYPRKGQFFVADREVSSQTGSIRLAGIFPNPGNILRPGQYARVRAVTETLKNALLVPQRAVSELQGSYQIAVVGPENKAAIRTVKPGSRIDSMWVIEEGLKADDLVIAEGAQRVRPGMPVRTKPVETPPENRAP